MSEVSATRSLPTGRAIRITGVFDDAAERRLVEVLAVMEPASLEDARPAGVSFARSLAWALDHAPEIQVGAAPFVAWSSAPRSLGRKATPGRVDCPR